MNTREVERTPHSRCARNPRLAPPGQALCADAISTLKLRARSRWSYFMGRNVTKMREVELELKLNFSTIL